MVSAITHHIFEPYADRDDCWGCGQPYEYGKFGLLCFYCGELYELRNPSPPVPRMFAGFSRYWAEEAVPCVTSRR